MKLSAISAAALLALVPGTMAWRVRFYENANYKGEEATWGGPGGTGTKCFASMSPLNNKASSMHWYAYNTERTTRCCITLYDSPNCQTKAADWAPTSTCSDAQVPNFQPFVQQNDVSSFRTTCVPV
ncbi:hypothetical protein B0O99DRAFT_640613 [Bisporella sp. PMI_857]|nr:hypothetical protein B0O99DRAFT_640613 [Bisporella sp. PMI_857]